MALTKEWVLQQETFDRLLIWLDADRNRAGERYEAIRSRLINVFVCRGCPVPEELADETINRVAKKMSEIAATYAGQPELYFYGVARRVHQEYSKRKPDPPRLPRFNPLEEIEPEYECLESCLQALAAVDQELILQYYQEEKQTKIDFRKEIAHRLGIAPNALRIRACRIRDHLRECIGKCLQQRRAG